MKYATIDASIATGASDSGAICIIEHPRVALECATFSVESASVGMQIYGCDTATGTFKLINVLRDNVVVPCEATAYVGGGSVVLDEAVSCFPYIKAHLKANTATAASTIRAICRTEN